MGRVALVARHGRRVALTVLYALYALSTELPGAAYTPALALLLLVALLPSALGDPVCGPEEYLEPVLRACAPCSKICHPQSLPLTDCINSCRAVAKRLGYIVTEPVSTAETPSTPSPLVYARESWTSIVLPLVGIAMFLIIAGCADFWLKKYKCPNLTRTDRRPTQESLKVSVEEINQFHDIAGVMQPGSGDHQAGVPLLNPGNLPLSTGNLPLSTGHLPLSTGHLPLYPGNLPLDPGYLPLDAATPGLDPLPFGLRTPPYDADSRLSMPSLRSSVSSLHLTAAGGGSLGFRPPYADAPDILLTPDTTTPDVLLMTGDTADSDLTSVKSTI